MSLFPSNVTILLSFDEDLVKCVVNRHKVVYFIFTPLKSSRICA